MPSSTFSRIRVKAFLHSYIRTRRPTTISYAPRTELPPRHIRRAPIPKHTELHAYLLDGGALWKRWLQSQEKLSNEESIKLLAQFNSPPISEKLNRLPPSRRLISTVAHRVVRVTSAHFGGNNLFRLCLPRRHLSRASLHQWKTSWWHTCIDGKN